MRDDQPLISVVLCFYNEERFINEAIQSVVDQTYAFWELILVDDGSTDKSVDFAKKLANENADKIFYLQHEGHSNRGLSASRNAGINICRGQLLAFIDADDRWLPDKLIDQLSIFNRHPDVSVLIEASLYWYSWEDQLARNILIPIGAQQDRAYDPPQLISLLYPLGNGAAPCPSGMMVRRSVFERSKFEESFVGVYQMYEDQGFLGKIYLREKVFVSSACHNQYRQRSSSLVSSVHETGRYDVVRKYYLEWFERFLKTEDLSDSNLEKLLRKALLPFRHPLRYQMTIRLPKQIKGLMARVLVGLGILHYPKKQ